MTKLRKPAITGLILLTISGCCKPELIHKPLRLTDKGYCSVNTPKFTDDEIASIQDSVGQKIVDIKTRYKERLTTICNIADEHDKAHNDN